MKKENELEIALKLLDAACKNSLENPKQLDFNFKGIDIANEILGGEYFYLIHACNQLVSKSFLNSSTYEIDVQKWFSKNYKKVLGKKFNKLNKKSILIIDQIFG